MMAPQLNDYLMLKMSNEGCILESIVTFSMVSMTIFLYCSFSSFKSSTILLMISDAPTLFASSTVVSTSCQK